MPPAKILSTLLKLGTVLMIVAFIAFALFHTVLAQ